MVRLSTIIAYSLATILIIYGALLTGLSKGLQSEPCEDEMVKSGIILGVMVICCGFFVFGFAYGVMNQTNPSTPVAIIAFTLVTLGTLTMIGIYIWSWITLLHHHGISCRLLKNSQVWVAICSLHIIFTPLITAFGSQWRSGQKGVETECDIFQS